MRQMSQLSLDAYAELKPKLTEREQWVLSAIENLGEASAETVAEYYGVGINIVSGRFTGLRNKRQILKSDKKLNKFGRNVQYYRPARTEILIEHE